MDFTESGMALRETMAALLDFQESNRLLAGKVSALDLHYEPDAELPPHTLNGKRLPDIELTLYDGRPARLYDFLHKGAFVLLSLRGAFPPVLIRTAWQLSGRSLLKHVPIGMTSTPF